MRSFKVHNSKTGNNTILTQAGIDLLKKDPKIAPHLEIIGEVDNRGNLIKKKPSGKNFLSGDPVTNQQTKTVKNGKGKKETDLETPED